MMLEFHKDGDHMGIVTDAESEDDFTRAVASALSDMIDKQCYTSDWAFQLELWLPAYADIIGALRGYKTGAEKHTVYSAGRPYGEVVGRMERNGFVVYEKPCVYDENGEYVDQNKKELTSGEAKKD